MKRLFFKAAFAAVLAAGLSVAANATDNPTGERQAMMKNVGAAIGMGSKMVKGELEFNSVAAQLVLKTMNTSALGFGYMFPEGSETGNETEASPAIWSDRAGFNAAVDKFAADTSVTVTDLASFKMAFGGAASNCGACHKAYRIKKQ